MKKTFSKIFAVAVVIAMLASLFTGLVPVSAAGAIDDIRVATSSKLISATGVDYTITTTYSTLAVNDTITLTFPQDTVITNVGTGDVTFGGTAATIKDADTDLGAGILTFYVPAASAYGTEIAIVVSDIVNPSNAGDYSLSLSYKGQPAVDSLPYTIANQLNITIYNAAGNLIRTEDNIPDAVVAVGGNGFTIKLGEGVYEGTFTMNTGDKGVTFTAAGALDATVIKGSLTVADDEATISGITIKGAMTVTGDDVNVDGCAFAKNAPPAAESLFTNQGSGLAVSDCTFDTTAGSVQDKAFVMDTGATNTSLSNCTFTLDQSAGLKGDYAIYMNAALTASGSPPSVLNVSGCTFTGSSGFGYYDAAGNPGVALRNNTFTSLESAVVIDNINADITIESNTISGSTKATAGAIAVTKAAKVKVINNVVKDNAGNSIRSTASTNMWVVGNQFSNNANGMYNEGATLKAPLNYWDSADGPTTATMPAGDTIAKSKDSISYKPFLSVAPTGVEFSNATNPSIGYHPGSFATVTGWAGTSNGDTFLSAMKLSAKPAEIVEPPYPAIAYFDIYNGGIVSDEDIQVKLYASGIAANTKAFYFSNLTGNWIQCYPMSVAAAGTYVQFSVKVADPDVKGYTPLAEDLTGTVFALVQGDASQPAAFDISAPEQGTTTGLSNIPFAWTTYPNATAYQFVLSAKYDLSNPIVKQDLTGVSTTAYIYAGPLTAGSYYWQVSAYKNNAVVAKSALGTFIAAAPAATATAAPTTYTTFTLPAPTTLTVTQAAPTTYTIQTPPAEQITPAWIWVLIVIGAILVIVVIVLIVRTRRAA